MSTLDAPHKISKRHELREDQVVTMYARTWGYVDENRHVMWMALGALVLGIALIAGWAYLSQSSEEEAAVALGAALPAYESGDLRAALDGTEQQAGLLAIADDFDGTPAGELAHFYAADALFRLGEFEAALDHFESFDSDDPFLTASALAGEAAAREAMDAHVEAAELYRRAARMVEGGTAAAYLARAGRAYEAAGEYEQAAEAYVTLGEEYGETPEGRNAEMLEARARARMMAAAQG